MQPKGPLLTAETVGLSGFTDYRFGYNHMYYSGCRLTDPYLHDADTEDRGLVLDLLQLQHLMKRR